MRKYDELSLNRVGGMLHIDHMEKWHDLYSFQLAAAAREIVMKKWQPPDRCC